MSGIAYLVDGVDEAVGAGLRVGGLAVRERARRQMERLGYEVKVVSEAADVPAGAPSVRADVVRPATRDLEGGTRVVDEASRDAVEDAVFREFLRGDLGLVARHINKRVSFWITRRLLCRLPVTPNQVTLGAGLVGLLGSALIASGRYGFMALGFFLSQAQSVLDGCDGELARVHFAQSRIGEWLDSLVDDGLNLSIIVAVGLGVSRAGGPLAPVAWPAALVGAALLAFFQVVQYAELVRGGHGGYVLNVPWWFSRGKAMKEVNADWKRGGAGALVMQVGRRDSVVFLSLLLGLAGWPEVVLCGWLLIAAVDAGVALGQVIWRLRTGRTPTGGR